MAPDVDKCLKEMVIKLGGHDEASAVDYLKKMRSRGRYSCDVWT